MVRWGLSIAMSLFLSAPAWAQDKKMEEDFKQALKDQSEKQLENVCRNLVLMGSAKDAKLILSAIKVQIANMAEEPDIYWIIIRAAAAFQKSDGLNAVAEHIVERKKEAYTKDLVMALHNNFSAACEGAMLIVLAGGSDEQRLSALEHLMDIGKKPSVDGVIELLRKEGGKLPPDVLHRAYKLLYTFTRQDYGESATNWIGWWDANKDKPWDDLNRSGAGKGGEKGHETGVARHDEIEKLKEAKVLIVHAGNACKCKRNHDLDTGIDRIMHEQPWKTEKLTKDQLDREDVTGESLFRDYIGIIAICTHIREHCCCPNCKPGKESGGLRLVKCEGCNVHENFTFKLSRKATGKIKDYVDRGGYLFAEDWSMEELVGVEWGNLVRHSKYLDDQEVQVLPKMGMGTHPYLRKIFVKPPTRRNKDGGTDVQEDVARLDYTYKIDKDSPAISIIDKKKVVTLMFSETIGAQSESQNGSDAVTVTFESGSGGASTDNSVQTGAVKPTLKGGRVVYTLAHFGKQPQTSGGEKGDYALTNLLINFLLESNERRLLRGK